MTHPILAAILVVILVFEGLKLVVAWRQQASNFARIRFERASRPKAFWALFSLHAVLIALMIVVLLDLTFGIRP